MKFFKWYSFITSRDVHYFIMTRRDKYKYIYSWELFNHQWSYDNFGSNYRIIDKGVNEIDWPKLTTRDYRSLIPKLFKTKV
jgi:hypothetical protein